jgi:hypothetical protein
MKQTIILLSTVILGIAISAMILSFRGTTQTITNTTQNAMIEKLDLDAGK